MAVRIIINNNKAKFALVPPPSGKGWSDLTSPVGLYVHEL